MTEVSLNLNKPRRPWWQYLVGGVLIALLTVLFLYGTMRQALRVNNHHDDQDAFMEFTVALAKDPTYIDGARTPLFSQLVRFFYHDGMTDDALFWQGVAVGIGVAVVCLVALGLYLFRAFPRSLALPLFVLIALNIYVITAPYYKPETLFYTLLFFAFVLMCRAFHKLTPWTALGIGLLLGVATLAKASATSVLGVFVVVKGLQIGWDWLRGNRARRPALMALGSLALVVVIFLISVSGYITSSRRIFGTTFYNVNTTFYMWYDTYDQVRTGTRQHYDRTGWPQMPPEQIPSAGQYLATHSISDMAHRVLDNLPAVYNDHCGKDYDTITAHCKYIGALGVMALVLGVMNLSTVWLLVRRNVFLLLFCALFIAATIATAAWWRPLSQGQRFSMPVVLPLLFLLASFINLKQLKRPRVTITGRQIDLITVALALMTVAVILDSITTLTWRVFRVRGAN